MTVIAKDDFHVGQEVLVKDYGTYQRKVVRRKGVVIKIARKYPTVEAPYGDSAFRPIEFEISSRIERHLDYDNYLDSMDSVDTWFGGERRKVAMDVWDQHDLGEKGYGAASWTDQQVVAIAKILDPEWVPLTERPASIDAILGIINQEEP